MGSGEPCAHRRRQGRSPRSIRHGSGRGSPRGTPSKVSATWQAPAGGIAHCWLSDKDTRASCRAALSTRQGRASLQRALRVSPASPHGTLDTGQAGGDIPALRTGSPRPPARRGPLTAQRDPCPSARLCTPRKHAQGSPTVGSSPRKTCQQNSHRLLTGHATHQ